MKRLAYIVLSLLVLASCTSRQEYAAMRQGLDSINELNRNDEPFTVSDVHPYVEYFNHHGEPNDRMLSHYLLGRAYHEQGEAPMALDYYQKAIECADTTNSDCDFAQLSRVYAQMGEIFYTQRLYTYEITTYRQAIAYSLHVGKEQVAINDYERVSGAYEAVGKLDSALIILDSVASWYICHKLYKDAAITMGRASSILIKQQDYLKAEKYISYYEQKSELFDTKGNIIKGCEVFYYYKGLLFLSQNKLDSAEFYFRKELQCGKDYNNQNAGSHGLSMLFQKKHMPDSVAKYALYSYAMNDSMYAQMTTEEVAKMQTMYDYSRHQEIARKESEKALLERNKRLLTMLLLLLCVSVASFIIYKMYKEKKESKKRYHSTLERLERTQSEVLQLRDMASDYSELKSFVEEKEQEIENLKSQLNQDQQKTLQSRAAKEEQIKRSKIFQSLLKKSKRGLPLCNEELRTCRIMVIDYLPELNNLLLSKQNYLNSKEFDLCVLFRLGFQSKEISNMLSVSPARISQMSASVLSKLFRLNEGGAKELIAKLSELY